MVHWILSFCSFALEKNKNFLHVAILIALKMAPIKILLAGKTFMAYRKSVKIMKVFSCVPFIFTVLPLLLSLILHTNIHYNKNDHTNLDLYMCNNDSLLLMRCNQHECRHPYTVGQFILQDKILRGFHKMFTKTLSLVLYSNCLPFSHPQNLFR